MLKHIFQMIGLLIQIVALLKELLALAEALQSTDPHLATGKTGCDYTYEDGSPAGYAEAELMTIDEATSHLHISRDKLTRMRKFNDLTSLYQKRNVRLIRAEVEKASRWYRKGGS